MPIATVVALIASQSKEGGSEWKFCESRANKKSGKNALPINTILRSKPV